MDEKLKEILERVIKITEPLASAAAVDESPFLVTLLGIYRISFATLRDIYYLTQQEETAASILDLTRKILEHGISVEYMIMKDKEGMAKRFQEYLIVQIHDEFEFYRSIGLDPSVISPEHKISVEENDKDYGGLSKDVRDRKNWAGRSVDKMIEDLNTAKALSEFDVSRLGQAYVWGSRLNHPNPMIVHSYLDPEEMKAGNSFFNVLGLSVAIAIHVRLTTRLIDESRLVAGSDIYPEIATDIGKLQEELNSLK